MKSNTNNTGNENILDINQTQINKYKLYNLLFNGKISLKEYLNALFYIKHQNKIDESRQ